MFLKKLLKIGPGYYEERQRNLYRWNPVGVISLVVASTLGTIAALGYMGSFLQSTATFLAAILAGILTVIIAIMTKGKFYVRHKVKDIPADDYIS